MDDKTRTYDLRFPKAAFYQLNYIHIITEGIFNSIKYVRILLLITFLSWKRQDSNLRSHKARDLQSRPFDHFGTLPLKMRMIQSLMQQVIFKFCIPKNCNCGCTFFFFSREIVAGAGFEPATSRL